MNIYLFDFDNTIVELPYEETIEYLDNDDSLNPKLNFKPIKPSSTDLEVYLNQLKKLKRIILRLLITTQTDYS